MYAMGQPYEPVPQPLLAPYYTPPYIYDEYRQHWL